MHEYKSKTLMELESNLGLSQLCGDFDGVTLHVDDIL